MHTSEIVWRKEITDKNIEDWLTNFKGEVFSLIEERRIALWLLSNFVYYNEDEVRHLCIQLFKEFIHKILLLDYNDELNLSDNVQGIIEKTGFLSLGKPSESSGYILYYFRQVNDLNMKNFLLPQMPANDDLDYLVFVDDVTLTPGIDGQSYSFLKRITADKKKKILLTIIATIEAIETYKNIDVEVISSITLDDRNKCFSPNSYLFAPFSKHLEKCKTFAHYYGTKAKSSIPLGFENGQFTFGFFYNTPDNTLPIFWGEENNWHPIVKRYDKNYRRRNFVYEQKFI
jgi:hypothetical protein